MGIGEYLTDVTVIFFIANSIYVISYTVTSMVWLRVLAIVAAVATFPYFYFQAEPLWSALFWQCCFLLVNGLNLGVLLYAMRTPHFDLIEQVVYKSKFEDLEPHEVVPIFKRAKQLSLPAGETLFEDGQHNETLFLIVSGECKAIKNGQEVATLNSGEFIGELSFVSGDRVSSDVVTSKECQMMCWVKSELEPLFKKQGLYKSYFYSMCSIDIAQKLRTMTAARTAPA